MRSFLRVATGVDFMPVLLEVLRQSDLWNSNTVRTFHERSAHRGLDDIVLRYNPFDPARDDFVDAVCSRIHVEDYPAFARMPLARQLVMAVMSKVQGVHLGRVFISRMAPGATIEPHVDRIAPAEEAFPDRIPPAIYYDRYHVPLQAGPGCWFGCGEEAALMLPGELWWFDNLQTHAVRNESGDDRIHLVIDIHGGAR